jgi:hypothetical protein
MAADIDQPGGKLKRTFAAAFQQPDQPVLPSAFKPDVTVSSGPPAASHPKPKQKGH